jgi:hypothetical protein
MCAINIMKFGKKKASNKNTKLEIYNKEVLKSIVRMEWPRRRTYFYVQLIFI